MKLIYLSAVLVASQVSSAPRHANHTTPCPTCHGEEYDKFVKMGNCTFDELNLMQSIANLSLEECVAKCVQQTNCTHCMVTTNSTCLLKNGTRSMARKEPGSKCGWRWGVTVQFTNSSNATEDAMFNDTKTPTPTTVPITELPTPLPTTSLETPDAAEDHPAPADGNIRAEAHSVEETLLAPTTSNVMAEAIRPDDSPAPEDDIVEITPDDKVPAPPQEPAPEQPPESVPEQAPQPAPPSPPETGDAVFSGGEMSGSEYTAMLQQINTFRQQNGKDPLAIDNDLMASAYDQTQEMAAHCRLEHTGLDGSTPSDRAERRGFTRGAGENIAAGQDSVDSVMTSWINSQGHRENLLNDLYGSVGFAKVHIPQGVSCTYSLWWAQTFGLK